MRELAASYDPPGFEHVPGPDAALFLAAIDHRTGYRGGYLVGGRGPYEGSALLWERGRDDPDLLGREAGDLSEPPRAPGSLWY